MGVSTLGVGLPVPVHAQHQRLQVVGIVAGDRDPNVADQSRSGLVSSVRVSPAAMVRASALPPLRS